MILSWIDVKLAFRMLVRYPGVSVVGGLAVFVGIGLGCGFFEFVDDFIRPSLPLDEGHRIVGLVNWDVVANAPERRSLHDFVMWRDELESVENVGAYTTSERNIVTGDGWAEPVTVAEISAAGFGLARVPPLIGRPLIESDEGIGADPVVVIGHELWEARFNGSPAVVGQRLQLGASVHTVVGVMPEEFTYPLVHDAWVPLRASVLDYERREGPPVLIVGRLASGYTLREAQTELTGLGMRAAAMFPETNGELRPRVLPYAESLVQGTEIMVLGHAFFVGLLLVVCGTVAALMFARTVARENEIAVRTALGASRLRVVGQIFLEGLAMCTVAAAAALAAVAYAMPRVKQAFWAVQQSRGSILDRRRPLVSNHCLWWPVGFLGRSGHRTGPRAVVHCGPRTGSPQERIRGSAGGAVDCCNHGSGGHRGRGTPDPGLGSPGCFPGSDRGRAIPGRTICWRPAGNRSDRSLAKPGRAGCRRLE